MSAVELATKECTKCGETKPASLFHRNSKNPDGLQYHCAECMRASTRESRRRRREEMGEKAWLELQRQIVAKSRSKAEVRERTNESNKAYYAALQSLRDLHPEQFDRLLAAERYERGLD